MSITQRLEEFLCGLTNGAALIARESPDDRRVCSARAPSTPPDQRNRAAGVLRGMTGERRLRTSLLFGLVSFALSLLVIFPLLGLAKVNLGRTLHLLASVSLLWFAALVGLTLVNAFLAAEKWRVANVIAGPGPPSLWVSFSLTAVGVGLGQVLPVPVATALARAVGARALGHGTMLRAGATTLFEQIFDVIVLGCIALVSFATLVLGGGPILWVALVLIVLFSCWLAAGRGTQSLAVAVKGILRRLPPRLRSARLGAALDALGCADRRLVRLLLLFSVLRFVTLVALSAVITAAVGLHISLWQLAAALPFAVIAVALAATPAGLGVNEWAMSAALFAFGTTMHTAVQWVVLSRILSTVASAAVGAIGGAIALCLWRIRAQRRRGADVQPTGAAGG